MLAAKYREQLQAKGKAKRRQETNAEWEAWIAKFLEAQKNGEEFNGPKPSELMESGKS